MTGGPERSFLASKLNKAARKLRLESWNYAKIYLSRFPWMPAIHDGPGWKFWDGTFQFGVLEQTGSDKSLA